MLKDKLKLPASHKPGRIFPDRLGTLVMVAGLDEKGNEIERSEFEVESGEELEAIKPGALGFHRESGDGGEAMDEEKDENDQRIRQKPNKDAASTSVSVLKSISLDEKRSDLEFEVRVVAVFDLIKLNWLGHKKLEWNVDYVFILLGFRVI